MCKVFCRVFEVEYPLCGVFVVVLVGEDRLVCGLFCVDNASSTFWFSLSELFFSFFSVTFLPLVSSFGVCSTHVDVLLVKSLLRLLGNFSYQREFSG